MDRDSFVNIYSENIRAGIYFIRISINIMSFVCVSYSYRFLADFSSLSMLYHDGNCEIYLSLGKSVYKLFQWQKI